MNTAIIVAAGSGTRFGGGVPKQFIEIHGKPLIIHTLEQFENCAAIDRIILVLSRERIQEYTDKAKEYGLKKLFKIIPGGESRSESVWNGLLEIPEKSAGIVAVHDGARPLVSVEEISQTVRKAGEMGAACLVGRVTDTIKQVRDSRIERTIDRTTLRRALTPQCFRFDIIKRAFEENKIGAEFTDECSLVEKLGVEIAFIEGRSENIKVTTRADLVFAQELLRQKM